MEDGYMLDGDGVDGVVVVRSLILHLDHMPDTVAEARPGRPTALPRPNNKDQGRKLKP